MAFLLLGYLLSSTLLAAGYRLRALGSSDVIYLGMVDTTVFLGVGTYLTSGAASPALFLFFAMPATYLVLATPRVFVTAAVLSGVAMTSSAVLVELEVWPGGLGQLAAGPHPLAYLAAAGGALALLASVGWRHSVTFAGRSQARQHLSAALTACKASAPEGDLDRRLFELLDAVMTALDVTDEGIVYRYEPSDGLLRRQVHLGIRPWFRSFSSFRPGEGNVGYAFQFNSRIVCQSSAQLEDMVQGLAPTRVPAGTLAPDTESAPAQTLAMPLAWQGEVLGVLVLSRHSGLPFSDERELSLVAAVAASMAGVMGQAHLRQRAARLEQEVTFQDRLQALLSALDLRQGVQDFVVHLREFVPFDCVKLVVVTPEGADPSLGHFWCPGDLKLDSGILDSYVHDLVGDSRHGAGAAPAVGTGVVPVPPGLGERGVASMAVVFTPPYHGGQEGQPQGGLVLLHWLPDTYDPQRVQLLRHLEPYLPLLFALSANSQMWHRKVRQLESLHQVVDLTRAGGDRQSIVQGAIQWASEQASLVRPGSVFAVLSDPDKGTLTVTAPAPSPKGDGAFQRHVVGAGSEELQKMFGRWPDSQPQLLSGDDPLARKVLPLLEQPLDSHQVLGFPFRLGGKTQGVLAVPMPASHAVDQDRRASIQQFVDVASLCLQNSQLYEAQARQARELRHEDELRRSFISFITHEFRTPLTSLKASFELVREADEVQGLADPYQRLMNNMGRSVSTLEQLISDLAEVANLSAGGVLLNRYWTSPESIVHPVIEMSTPLSHLKRQSLAVEIQPGLPEIMADSRRLEQVLANLVSNALKYTPAGGAIRISVAQEDKWIKFGVADTGRGIPPEYVARLFQPFFRVPTGTAQYAPGTGLGLALAKSLVELHGGKIWVETTPDKGCTFYFTVPIPQAGV
jgi:signal transduction histidine kinase